MLWTFGQFISLQDRFCYYQNVLIFEKNCFQSLSTSFNMDPYHLYPAVSPSSWCLLGHSLGDFHKIIVHLSLLWHQLLMLPKTLLTTPILGPRISLLPRERVAWPHFDGIFFLYMVFVHFFFLLLSPILSPMSFSLIPYQILVTNIKRIV